jgi:hypothetical protein
LLFVAGKELGERKEGPSMAHKCNPASEEDENLVHSQQRGGGTRRKDLASNRNLRFILSTISSLVVPLLRHAMMMLQQSKAKTMERVLLGPNCNKNKILT